MTPPTTGPAVDAGSKGNFDPGVTAHFRHASDDCSGKGDGRVCRAVAAASHVAPGNGEIGVAYRLDLLHPKLARAGIGVVEEAIQQFNEVPGRDALRRGGETRPCR